MPEAAFVITLRPEHASRIYAGKKPLEFRRRLLSIPEGSWAYVYETAPIGAVTGMVKFGKVHAAGPGHVSALLAKFPSAASSTLEQYLAGASKPCAIEVYKSRRFRRALSLHELRDLEPHFRPPQSIVRISTPTGRAILRARAA